MQATENHQLSFAIKYLHRNMPLGPAMLNCNILNASAYGIQPQPHFMGINKFMNDGAPLVRTLQAGMNPYDTVASFGKLRRLRAISYVGQRSIL